MSKIEEMSQQQLEAIVGGTTIDELLSYRQKLEEDDSVPMPVKRITIEFLNRRLTELGYQQPT